MVRYNNAVVNSKYAMIDTHCHLQFGAFEGRVDDVIRSARTAGVDTFIVPGTDIDTSRAAIAIAAEHPSVFAAVGIHPHHVFEADPAVLAQHLRDLEDLLRSHPEVVAVGEVGMDRHYYQMTKYREYAIDDSFIERQKNALRVQISLALTYDKSLILHNREAKNDFLSVLKKSWDGRLAGRTVLHCCEPDPEFIHFADSHDCYIGVDGDVTFDAAKQEFIRSVPIGRLVLETDSPFLTPEPVRSSARKRPKNEPAYLPYIAEHVATLKAMSMQDVIRHTTANAVRLFRLPEQK